MAINVFADYRQKENQFTNGLFSLLDLSRHERPHVIADFLDIVALRPATPIETVLVLELGEMKGYADAELSGKDCCIWFETKIRSGQLDGTQIQRHLANLHCRSESIKKLVLLTPDDSGSNYVRQFLSTGIIHLQWRKVYDHLHAEVGGSGTAVFSELVRQYLEKIHADIFEKDEAGIILKVDFGDKSGVYAHSYRDEMRRGEWDRWNTPRQYKKLDGTGRKLLLYDRELQAITVEVEIRKVKLTKKERNYPWTNFFVRDKPPTVYQKPIPLDYIETIPGFENFGSGRSANWNMTQEQYRLLKQLRG